jgi:hypothetical protein
MFKKFLSTLDNTIGIIPLDESQFSSCKSPIKFLDFALAGIPAVCSNVAPYSDIILDGTNGLLCQNQEEDWYKAVCNLAQSAALRTKIADAAGELSKTEYSMQHVAEVWNGVFNTTKAGQGTIGSRLIKSKHHLLALAQKIITPTNYQKLIRVLRNEGIRGVTSRITRNI